MKGSVYLMSLATGARKLVVVDVEGSPEIIFGCVVG